MAEWRLLRGWANETLKARLDQLAEARLNFGERELDAENGWHHYSSESVIAQRSDDSCFERARVALMNYQFSDPDIVQAHFDPATVLANRRMLLEIRVFGLHYLCPVLVTRVRNEPHLYGFRYDTLEGHIERGGEWFVVMMTDPGVIRFRIEARWQTGDLPNWWSRIGFVLLSGHYQRKWHRRAHHRMSLLALYGSTTPPRADRSGLTHQGSNVTFTYHAKRK
jgi:uncharacterized protein (UPF0548 family)